MEQISVNEFSKVKSEDVFLLDVRTIEEFAYVNIGGVNIPLDEIRGRLAEIPKENTIYCLCHHGVRSQHAQFFLKSHGYENVFNIEGGIDAWSHLVDPSIITY